MTKFTLSLVSAALMACVFSAHAAEELLPKHLQDIEALQKRADKLTFDPTSVESYHFAKARAWLDLALSEYHQTDTTGLVYAATVQGKDLLDGLENKVADMNMDTPKNLVGTELVRTDLWDKIAAMKAEKNFACGQAKIGEAEVYLVWTGHEKMESGWTHAESYARGTENLIYEAKVQIDNCNAAPVVAAAVPLPRTTEKMSLSGDALFVFGSDKLVKGAEASLNTLAESIKGWTALQGVELVGHTDRLRTDGNEAKNVQLSQARAARIKQFLVGKGIAADKIVASGAGSGKPVKECSTKTSKAVQVQCLQPNRRVEIILKGEK
jgi:outer membrane protein OmpA-like peptidoglycan-associated protein